MATPTPTSSSVPTPEKAAMDKHELQIVFSALHATLDMIPTLPAAVENFTAVDRALLDALNCCVGVLSARHLLVGGAVASEAVTSGENGNGDQMNGDRANGVVVEKGRSGGSDGKKRTIGLDKLEKLITELMLSVNLLGSTWEVEDGAGCVVDCVEEVEEKREGSVKEEEGWVDVGKEDVDVSGNGDIGKAENDADEKVITTSGDAEKEVEEEEKDNLLPPLSPERKDDILQNITSVFFLFSSSLTYQQMLT